MIEEVKVSYQGDNDYPQVAYSVESQPLPVLPCKGEIITLWNTAGKKRTVKIKKRTVRCEGNTLHVALDVLEICNA